MNLKKDGKKLSTTLFLRNHLNNMTVQEHHIQMLAAASTKTVYVSNLLT